MNQLAPLDSAIADCEARLDRLYYARMLADAGEGFALDLESGELDKFAPPQAGVQGLNQAYKMLNDSHLKGLSAGQALARLKAEFPVREWQLNAAWGPASDCIRLFGVAAMSDQGPEVLLALWKNNARRALSNSRMSDSGEQKLA